MNLFFFRITSTITSKNSDLTSWIIVFLVLFYFHTHNTFLGSFEKLLKATISFVSVRPPAWNNSAPGGRILRMLDIWAFYENLSRVQVSLKSEKNNGYFTWRLFTFMTLSRLIILRMRNVLDVRYRENNNIYFMFSNFFPENRAVYDNVEKCSGTRAAANGNMAARCVLDL